VGSKHYKDSKGLLITAEWGGRNGYKVYLWKVKIQEFANEINKEIRVLYFPPGASKWNKIEHRFFRLSARTSVGNR
jgi:hypothetical protein